MVILHPDHVATADLGTHRFRELEVCFPVCEPILFVKVHFAGVVVEQWPEDGVRETVVVPVCEVVVEIDSLTGVLFHETLVDDWSVLDGDVEAWPTYPSERHGLFAAGERGDETARGHLEVVLALCIFRDRDRQPVGYNDETFFAELLHCGEDGRM